MIVWYIRSRAHCGSCLWADASARCLRCVQCLKFLTDQAQDLKRIDKLNNLFLTYMCGKDPYADPADEAPPNRPASGGDDGDKAASNSDRPASGGGKKKKAKK